MFLYGCPKIFAFQWDICEWSYKKTMFLKDRWKILLFDHVQRSKIIKLWWYGNFGWYYKNQLINITEYVLDIRSELNSDYISIEFQLYLTILYIGSIACKYYGSHYLIKTEFITCRIDNINFIATRICCSNNYKVSQTRYL